MALWWPSKVAWWMEEGDLFQSRVSRKWRECTHDQGKNKFGWLSTLSLRSVIIRSAANEPNSRSAHPSLGRKEVRLVQALS